jgi:hypothetical protein
MVDDDCDIEVIVKSVAALTCDFVFLIKTNWNSIKIVYWEFHVVFIS